jgi:hypothetical protein
MASPVPPDHTRSSRRSDPRSGNLPGHGLPAPESCPDTHGWVTAADSVVETRCGEADSSPRPGGALLRPGAGGTAAFDNPRGARCYWLPNGRHRPPHSDHAAAARLATRLL